MTSIMRFDQWQSSLGTNPSNISELVPAYAQFNATAGFTTSGNYYTIPLNESYLAKNISLNTSTYQITFSVTGVYKFDVGFRFGTGGDYWTGISLVNAAGTVVATSFGTGMVTNDPGPAMFNFMYNVTDISTTYTVKIYRNSSASLAVATPDASAGKAVVANIIKVG